MISNSYGALKGAVERGQILASSLLLASAAVPGLLRTLRAVSIQPSTYGQDNSRYIEQTDGRHDGYRLLLKLVYVDVVLDIGQ